MPSDGSLTHHRASKAVMDGQAEFDFQLALRTGYINRRVECREYAGDSRWKRSISFDINVGQVGDLFDSLVRKKADLGETVDETVNLPLFDIEKGTQFVEFSAYDRKGNPLHLLQRNTAIHVAVNQVKGALEFEAGDQGNSGIEQTQSQECLFRYLSELFKSDTPLLDSRRNRIELSHPDSYEYVKSYIKKDLEGLKLPENADWNYSDVLDVERAFGRCWERSRVFRYLVVKYTLRRLVCLSIELEDDFSLIKSSFVVTEGIAQAVTRKPDYPRARFSGGMTLDIELDGIGVGESDHVIITAPEGMHFTPCYPKGVGKHDGRDFFVMRHLHEADHSCEACLLSPEAEAKGSLAPGHAIIKSRKNWYDHEIEISDDAERTRMVSSLYRKLPIEESHANFYTLCLNLVPRLGLRSLGYFSYFVFSLIAFLLIFLEILFGSVEDSAPKGLTGFSALVALAPMVIMIAVNRKPEPYLSRAIFRLPTRLCVICTLVDSIGFALLVIFQYVSIDWMWKLASMASLAVVLLIITMTYSLWAAFHLIKKFVWNRRPNAFKTFSVPFYNEDIE